MARHTRVPGRQTSQQGTRQQGMTDDPTREQAKADMTIDALATEPEVAREMDHATSARGLDTGPETVPTGKRGICSQQERRTGRESTARCTT